jgi:hypothetical protein
MEDLNNLFNKLSLEEQSKFIITNILNNKNFVKIHDLIKNNYYNYFLEGEELIKHKLKINNDKIAKNICNELIRYEKAVDKCLSNQSRYDDIVYWVYDAQQDIERYCKSKYINGDKDLLEKIVDCYNDTEGTIYQYGGEKSGDEDQTLKNAIKILLNNPYLDENIKNSEKYKEYYEEFINGNDDDEDEEDNNDNNNYNDDDDDDDDDDNEDDDEDDNEDDNEDDDDDEDDDDEDEDDDEDD